MPDVIVEPTPNPATRMFRPGRAVMESGTRDFPSAGEAASSPLAARLFRIDGVAGVFLGADFVSVAKSGAADWAALEDAVAGAIAAHFAAGEPVVAATDHAGTDAGPEDPDDEDAETVRQIRELLETRVRPQVAMDGGDIVYRGFDRGVVYLSLQGACVGCPSSSATLKMGIENLLRHFVPDVIRVEAVA